MEGNLAGVGLAERPKHLDTAASGHRRGLPRHPALADTRGSHHTHDAPVAIDRAVQNGFYGGHLPAPTNQARQHAPDKTMPRLNHQQATRRHPSIDTLDVHRLVFTQHRAFLLDQVRGGLAEHHPTRRGDRLHPLRHAHLLTDRGVTESTRTDLTGDHLTGIESDTQLKVYTVALSDVDGKPLGLLLNSQGSQTGTNSVVLQLHRRTKHRHDPVAGELVHRAAIALHHQQRHVPPAPP